MGLFDWLRKPATAPTIAPVTVAFSDADKRPTSIREFGVHLQLPFRWEKHEDPELAASTVCYVCPPIPIDSVLLTQRQFAQPLTLQELEAQHRAIAEKYLGAIATETGARLDGPAVNRTGNGQAELRVYASGGKNGSEAAWLHRGDAGRTVTVAFYRAKALTKPLKETMDQLFDLVEFTPSSQIH